MSKKDVPSVGSDSTPPTQDGCGASVSSLSYIPRPSVPWRAVLLVMWILTILCAVVGTVRIFMHKWFTESLGLSEVFAVDFKMGSILFLIFGGLFALAASLPFFLYGKDKGLKRGGVHVAIWAGVIGGSILSLFYHDFLLAANGEPFGKTDDFFGRDFSFYVFTLPAFWISWWAALAAVLLSILCFFVARIHGLSQKGGPFEKEDLTFGAKAGLVMNRGFLFLGTTLGLLLALGTFFSRYVLLYWHNDENAANDTSSILTGPTFVDVRGLFSNLNSLYLNVAVELVVTAALAYVVYRSYNAFRHLEFANAARQPIMVWKRGAVLSVVALILFDGAFFGAVQLRQLFVIKPNEPHIQKEAIEAHIAHTLDAYAMNDVEVVEWKPTDDSQPPETLVGNRTVMNAPILPGFVGDGNTRDSHLSGYRIGNEPFYAPLLEIFQQRQQLRPYYQFINIDSVRYRVDGEKRMFASAPRELPSAGIVDKGKHNWASSALQYTHGFGLVTAPVSQVDDNGDPIFVSGDIPVKNDHPLFDVEPRIYFGEGGTGRHILTNIDTIQEFDFATAQSRSVTELPEDVGTGIRIDSLFKRLILALWSYDPELGRAEIGEFLFTRFIDQSRTRAQVYRGPTERVLAIAPFLLVDDTSNVASVSDGKIVWTVNGLTVANTYPYSRYREFDQENRWGNSFEVNYVRDSVKVTIDAYSGETQFYKVADEPVINTWAKVYPTLFKTLDEMPEGVRSQLNYPLELFHAQFDDTYKRYHQKHYLEFYNSEDLWDDADEALGVLSDQKTVSYHATHYLLDPKDLPEGIELEGKEDDLQYVLMQPFTPKEQRNLRSVVMVFEDPENYGKIVSLQVPQGEFVHGPEQADALIDADPEVNAQLTLWERSGCEAINGHTLLLPVQGDVLYVEPIFAKSTMNNYPRLAMVATLYKGRVTRGRTIAEAIRQHGLSPSDVPSPLEELDLMLGANPPTDSKSTDTDSVRPTMASLEIESKGGAK